MREPTLLQGPSFNRVGEKAERVLYLQSFRIDPRTNQWLADSISGPAQR